MKDETGLIRETEAAHETLGALIVRACERNNLPQPQSGGCLKDRGGRFMGEAPPVMGDFKRPADLNAALAELRRGQRALSSR